MDNQVPKEQKPRKSKKWLWIIGGVVAFFIIIAIAGGGGEKKETPAFPSGQVITEVTSGDVKFKLVEAEDLGKVLKCPKREEFSLCEDKATEGKFIKVTVEAENVGKEPKSFWGLGRLIDDKGREYDNIPAFGWIPEESNCGGELKPGFSPKLCTEIYEVAADSTGLKVEVKGSLFKIPKTINLGI